MAAHSSLLAWRIHGQRSLMDLRGVAKSDTTEATQHIRAFFHKQTILLFLSRGISLQSFQNYRTWKFILNQYCCSRTVTAESNFVFISGHFLGRLNTIVCECVYMRVCAQSLRHAWLFATPWTVAHQAPLSVGFSGQEQWSRLPFPSPGDLPDPGIEPASPVSLTLAGHKSFPLRHPRSLVLTQGHPK